MKYEVGDILSQSQSWKGWMGYITTSDKYGYKMNEVKSGTDEYREVLNINRGYIQNHCNLTTDIFRAKPNAQM